MICIVLSRLCLVCAVFFKILCRNCVVFSNPILMSAVLSQTLSELCYLLQPLWFLFIFFSLVRHRNVGQPDPDLGPGDVSLCSPCTDILLCLGQALAWVVWCTFYGVITIHNKNCLSSVIGREGVSPFICIPLVQFIDVKMSYLFITYICMFFKVHVLILYISLFARDTNLMNVIPSIIVCLSLYKCRCVSSYFYTENWCSKI